MQTAVLGYIFIYVLLIHYSFYVFDSGGGRFKPSKGVVQLEYESMYRKCQADPDNLRPYKCTSTVFFSNLKLVFLLSPHKGESGE
jgi:hypothetical protein